MADVILLNYDFSIINHISTKKALKLVIKGKASIISDYGISIYNHLKKELKIMKPKIVRMLYQIQDISKRKMTYSNHGVFARDKNTCVYCGKKPHKLTIDHVVPKAQGGKTSYENCVAACFDCNVTKNNRTPEEAGMRLLKRPYHPTILDYLKIKFGNFDFENIEINWG